MDIHPEILQWPVQDTPYGKICDYGTALGLTSCGVHLGGWSCPAELLSLVQAHAERDHLWRAGGWVSADKLLAEERAARARPAADVSDLLDWPVRPVYAGLRVCGAERVTGDLGRAEACEARLGGWESPRELLGAVRAHAEAEHGWKADPGKAGAGHGEHQMLVSRTEVAVLVGYLDRAAGIYAASRDERLVLSKEMAHARMYFGTRLRGGLHSSDQKAASFSPHDSLRSKILGALRKVRESQDAICLRDAVNGPRWVIAHSLREMLDELIAQLEVQ